VGVGGYPEKHIEAPNFKTDIRHLKAKIDAGAGYVVTQMCFDNDAYFAYVDMCREAGITVPIIPGIKLIDGVRQLTSLPKNFHVTLPDELVDEITENQAHVAEIGRRWARRQVEGLIEGGAPCIHFYVMNDAAPAVEVVRDLV
jgi:methylenetetrahydrofolate reductase (NADPH)